MEQRDYLKRQIDQLGIVLGKIAANLLGIKNQGQISSGIEIANQMFKEELDIDIEELIHFPEDNFIHILQAEKGFNDQNLEKLTDILLFIAANEPNQDQTSLYKKCLILHAYLEKVENIYSLDRQWKIEQLKNTL